VRTACAVSLEACAATFVRSKQFEELYTNLGPKTAALVGPGRCRSRAGPRVPCTLLDTHPKLHASYSRDVRTTAF
jgi:hypothetical protein